MGSLGYMKVAKTLTDSLPWGGFLIIEEACNELSIRTPLPSQLRTLRPCCNVPNMLIMVRALSWPWL